MLVLNIAFPNAGGLNEINFVLHALNAIVVCLAFKNFMTLTATIVILRVYTRLFGVAYEDMIGKAAYVSIWLVVFAARYVLKRGANWVRSIIE